jgi:hypothetical protein
VFWLGQAYEASAKQRTLSQIEAVKHFFFNKLPSGGVFLGSRQGAQIVEPQLDGQRRGNDLNMPTLDDARAGAQDFVPSHDLVEAPLQDRHVQCRSQPKRVENIE